MSFFALAMGCFASAANLLQNGSFESGISPWFLNVNYGYGTLTADSTTSAPGGGSYSAKLYVGQSRGDIWDVAAIRPHLAINGYQQYAISFYAKADTSGRQVLVALAQAYAPYSNYFTQIFSLSTSWQQYSIKFTPSVSDSNVELLMASGQQQGSVSVDLVNFGLVDPPAPAISYSPLSFNFGNSTVGDVSAVQTLTVKNSGTSNLIVSTATLSGNFQWGPATSTMCSLGSSIAPGASCTMAIDFAPQSAGSLTGSLTLTDNTANSTQVIPLAGTGVAPAPVLSYSPSSVNFGSVAVGSSSFVHTLAMNNSGNGNLVISSVALSGNFKWGPATPTTCVVGSTMAPGSSCTMAVYFAPQSAGSLTGSLTLTNNTANSKQVISLAGTGTGISLSPTAGLITNFISAPHESFNIGGVAYEVQDAGQSYSIEEVDDQTLRFEVKPGDQAWYDGGANLDRAEAQMDNQWAIGTPITIEYQFMLEPGSTNTSDWFVTAELHNDDVHYPTSPPVSIMLAPGDYFWVQGRYCDTSLDPSNSASNQVIMNLYTAPTPVVRGQWYDIKVEMKVINDSSGYLYVWIDGNQVVNYNGPLGYGPINGPQDYWEEGLYRDREYIDTAAEFRGLTVSPAPTIYVP